MKKSKRLSGGEDKGDRFLGLSMLKESQTLINLDNLTDFSRD
jgi:hypothetical protein